MSTIWKTTVGAAARGTIKTAGICFHLLEFAFLLTKLRWVAGFALAGCLGWQGLRLAAPSPPVYTGTQLDMTGRLAGAVTDWLRLLAVPPAKAVFGNLHRDEFGVVSSPVREAVWRSDRFDLLERPLADRLRARVSWPLKTFASASELAAEARASGARYAVGGEVLRFVDVPGERFLRARLYVWDALASRAVGERTFEVNPDAQWSVSYGPPSSPVVGQAQVPITYRLFFWVILAGLLPFVVFVHPKALLADAGNLAVFALLAALTVIGGASLFWIVGRGLEPFWSGFWLLVLVPAHALYNFKMLAFFQENCI